MRLDGRGWDVMRGVLRSPAFQPTGFTGLPATPIPGKPARLSRRP
ncbi:hypothetical protein [Lysobacter gummosus]